ncbi:transposase [uncultured Roseovarius sp.]|uniref:transposase n=1 Tax=uncultured Roseovarius sp. TaxID=293344 RepID=UPI002603A3E0|nr:transposase [uncultured Roseovarius sp.]
MSRYIRSTVTGAVVFFTDNLARRGGRLGGEIGGGDGACEHTPYACFSTRWGAIKARFTQSVRRAGFTPQSSLPIVRCGRYAGVNPGLRHDKGEIAIWQRRFWEHHIRNEEDYGAHGRYCHLNPMKHGFVERPEEWLFSLVHRGKRAGRYEFS